MTNLPKVEIDSAVLEIIEEHCFSETTLEVGGFLVGKASKGVTSIVHALPALKAISGQVNLTFGHDAWEEALATVQRDHPEERIIGWYHSHPGFGLFLSDYDSFIQENFFSDPSHVALVVDPLAGILGWFVVRDRDVIELFRKDTKHEAILPPAAEKIEIEEEQSPKREGGLFRMLALTVALASILGLTIGWYVHNTAVLKAQKERQAKSSAMQATCLSKFETYKRKFPSLNLAPFCTIVPSGNDLSIEILIADMDPYAVVKSLAVKERLLRWYNSDLDKKLEETGDYILLPRLITNFSPSPTPKES